MSANAFAYPILPGKLDAWKRFLEEMSGARRTEMEAFERRVGMTLIRAWHQTTPQGDFAILYQQGDDVANAPQRIAALQDPFAVWFKQQVLEVHGVDFNQSLPGPLPELVFDWKAQ